MAKAPKKNVKKPASKVAAKKPAAPKSKSSAKPMGSQSAKNGKKEKAAPHHSAKSGASKAHSAPHAKPSGKEREKEKELKHDSKHHKAESSGDAKLAKKSGGNPKKKKEKKGKEGFELEDTDLLASEDEMGSEEIPDLSEFDENEGEEGEVSEEETTADEMTALSETKNPDDEIVLTDAEGRRYCRVRDCDQISAVEGYCRYHYLLLWKKIQVRRKILADGKLERYVDELTARYPDKFLEMIRKDLRTEKDFLAAIAELEIDESSVDNEFEDETQSYVDEIRGMSTDTGMTEEEEF